MMYAYIKYNNTLFVPLASLIYKCHYAIPLSRFSKKQALCINVQFGCKFFLYRSSKNVF